MVVRVPIGGRARPIMGIRVEERVLVVVVMVPVRTRSSRQPIQIWHERLNIEGVS